MKNLFNRVIASFLALTFLSTQSPMLAQELVEPVVPQNKGINSFKEPEVLCEVNEKREEFVKHFRMSDGSMIAVVYSDQIHYKDGNEFKEIDNTLVEDKEEYKNTDSPLKISVSKGFNNKKLVSLNSKGHDISWSYIKKNRRALKKLEAESKILDGTYMVEECSKFEADSIVNNKDLNKEKTNSKSTKKAEETTEVAEVLDVKPEKVRVQNSKTKSKNFKSKKDELTDVSKVSSNAKYKNVDPEVDFDYMLLGLGVKESIIINKKLEFTQNDSFDFEFKTNDLNIEKDKNGNLLFIDKDRQTVYTMPKGPMWDSAEGQAFSDEVDYRFKEVDGGYIISIVPNYEWINSEDRVFPIVIDPSITASPSTNSIIDTHVSQSSPNTAFPTDDHLPAGRYNENDNYISYVKFANLPAFSHGEIVTSAILKMYYYSYTTNQSNCILARKVTNSWDRNTLTWNNRPSVDPIVIAYMNLSSYDAYSLNLTKFIKEAYDLDDPNSNNGIGLYSNFAENNQNGIVRFVSTNNTSLPNDRPKLEIQYRNFIGEEPYWSYTNNGAGLKGSGRVNNYAGTLSLSENVLSYSGSRNPVSIINTYNNSNYNERANTNIHLQKFQDGYPHSSSTGFGWSLNFNKLLYKIPESDPMCSSSGGNIRYLYVDEDGTWHYFKLDDNQIIDEDGLGLQINEVVENSSIISLEIVDKNDNKLIFKKPYTSDVCYSLDSSQDSNGNTIVYYYDYQPGTPSSKVSMIKDAAGRETHIAYDTTHGMVSEITEADGQKTTFSYEGKNLNKITYPDGLKTGYVYDGQGRLSKVWTDSGTGSSVRYQYTSNSFKSANFFKVRSVTEYGSQNGDKKTEGNSVSFFYDEGNATTITRKINNLDTPYGKGTQVWQFDDLGRATTVMGEDGTFYETEYFKKDEETVRTKNRIKERSSGQKVIHNLLKNSAANSTQDNGMEYWEVTNWQDDSAIPNITASNDTANLGTKSFKVDQNSANASWPVACQKVLIPKSPIDRKFTLSADVKVNGTFTSGSGASLHLAAFKDNAQLGGDNYSEWLFTTDDDWRRMSVTINVPAGSDSIRCYFGIKDSIGTAYFDCLQLEEGAFASDYNAIENCNFKDGLSSWTASNFTTNDVVKNNGLRIVGETTKTKNICQRIDVNKKNPVFNIAVKARANSVPRMASETTVKQGFYVAFEINYLDGTAQTRVDEYFNPNITTDQYYFNSISSQTYSDSSLVTPDKMVDYVRIFVCYNYNCNEAYVKDVQVTLGDGVDCFVYDANGNMIGHRNKLEQNTKIDYTSSNEIWKVSENRENVEYVNGEKVKTTVVDTIVNEYSSQNAHNLVSNTSPVSVGRNIKYGFSYDNYGNIIASQLGADTTESRKINSSTTYSNSGNYVVSSTDSRGNVTAFNYNESNGNLNSSISPRNVTTNYIYDNAGRIISASCEGVQSNYLYNNGILSSVSHKVDTNMNVVYHFTRNIFGEITNSKVGNQLISTNTYDKGNGLLKQVKYGNNQQVRYDYDKLGRLIKKSYYNGQNKQNSGIEYVYDNKDRLVQTFDEENNLTTRLEYNQHGEVSHVRRSDGVSSDIKYNVYRHLIDKVVTKVFGITQTVENVFGASDLLENSKITVKRNGIEEPIWSKYEYDTLGRVDLIETLNKEETAGIRHKISYIDVGENDTTNLVNSIELEKKSGQNWVSIGSRKKFIYTYNEVGNIKEVKDTNGNLIANYEYDNFNQLEREDNNSLGETIHYSYDLGGNLKVKKVYIYTNGDLVSATLKKTLTYNYLDENWKDKLTSYEIAYEPSYVPQGQKSYTKQNIIYDGVGNPTNYRDGWEFEWARGKQLDKASNLEHTITYKYNDEGLRTQKTVNGVTTYFVASETKVLAQKCGDDKILWQIDGNGDYIGFNYNDVQFFYLKNAKGDIIGITDVDGNIKAEYVYDSWGKVVSILNASGTNIGDINPIRYRGYYYDSESGLYYVNSRYYDPLTYRFINADTTDVMMEHVDDSIFSTNLYSYCFNNPINMSDPDGESAIAPAAIAIGAGFSGLFGTASSVVAAGGANFWNPVGWTILGIAGAGVIVYGGYKVYQMSKGGKQNVRDTGLAGVSDQEISRRLKDPKTPNSEKQKLKKEQKARGDRNKQKRGNK